jgi:hypothetical protein
MLQEAFLISAAGTIIVVRLQLWATNYPQIGGGKLHIAHVLWGGLFMLIAIGMSLSFLGRRWRPPVAVIGGVGFGLFIDEIGKFITADNDYFFKPTAAIIYIVFIVLYLATQWVRTAHGFSDRENLVNAIDELAEAARTGSDERARAQMLALLNRAGEDPLVQPLRALVLTMETIPRSPGILRRMCARVMRYGSRLVETHWFRILLIWAFAVWTAGTFLTVLILVTAVGFKLGGAEPAFRSDVLDKLTIPNIASLASSVVAAGFVTVGIVRFHHGNRRGGYRMLGRAMLVQIFITQPFIFVESSFSAVTGFLASLLLLVVVRYLERRETEIVPWNSSPRSRTDVEKADRLKTGEPPSRARSIGEKRSMS